MLANFYDVIVIGAGPAGLAAALASDKHNTKTLLIEREANLGGTLKQCIHEGFGAVKFGENLTGPEYAQRYVSQLEESHVETALLSFVTKIIKQPFGFSITLVNTDGIVNIACKSIVLACGCRERTSRQIGIHGRHSAGVITAGTAQYYTNVLGKMPTKRCVVLGSGDVGLIAARSLKQEGADVLGVFEAMPAPSGQLRNVYQCLDDFDIPLYTSKTITRVFGEGRLNAVEVSSVDNDMEPIPGTEQIIECDALILSVGLIPENELAESLDISINENTKGPVTDQDYMTMLDGVFCCGNALHVNDLVDYVSENGEAAGHAAARWAITGWINARRNGTSTFAEITTDDSLLYIVPQRLNIGKIISPTTFYFRSRKEMGQSLLSVTLNGNEIYRKIYPRFHPPETERLVLDFEELNIDNGSTVNFSLSQVTDTSAAYSAA